MTLVEQADKIRKFTNRIDLLIFNKREINEVAKINGTMMRCDP